MRATDVARDFPRAIRIVPDLRASQVADAAATPQALVLYFRRHYDLGGTPLSSRFRQVTLRAALRELASTRTKVLELPEPLWVRFLPTNCMLAAAWYWGRMRGHSRGRVRAYAIENNDPVHIVYGRAVPSALDALTRLALGAVIRVIYSRFAWGSEGARDAYLSLPFVRGVPARMFVELPPRPAAVSREAAPLSAIFIGHLHERKGLRATMQAWESVEQLLAGAQLTLVGVGPLQEQVVAWTAEAPTTRRYLGQVEHGELPALLRRHAVLVAPSVRDGRWREQIGLPIVEALGEGVTVVTSSETGLAPWLERRGHRVIGAAVTAGELASAVVAALSSPLSRERVIDSLPEVSPRAEAARWLAR